MKPISCDLHDYLEIACMYKIQVHLVLTDGENYSGMPITIRVNTKREECLQLLLDSSNERIDLVLYQLETMEAVTPNNHFSKVLFSPPKPSE